MDPEVQNKIAAMAEALGVKAEALYRVLVDEVVVKSRVDLIVSASIGAAALLAFLVCAIACWRGKDEYLQGAREAGLIISSVAAAIFLSLSFSSYSKMLTPNTQVVKTIVGG